MGSQRVRRRDRRVLTMVQAASLALIALLTTACSDGVPHTNTADTGAKLILPSISHAGDGYGAGDTDASLPITRAWKVKLAALADNYPEKASAAQKASLQESLANTTPVNGTCAASQEGDPTPSPSQLHCWFGSLDAQRSWTVIGDNVITQWQPAFQAIAASNSDLRIDVFKLNGCPNSASVKELSEAKLSSLTPALVTQCTALHELAAGRVRANRPDLIVLSDDFNATSSTADKLYLAGLAEMVQSLQRTSPVAVMGRPVRWNIAPTNCLNEELANLRSCFGLATTQAGRIESRRITADSVSARFLDVRPWMCSGNICPLFVGNHIVTTDGVLLSPAFATDLAQVLYENLNAASTSTRR